MGLVGFISQLGYVIAYSVSGVAADAIGSVTGQGVGRGAAVTVFIAGVCLAVTAAAIPILSPVRRLEKAGQSL